MVRNWFEADVWFNNYDPGNPEGECVQGEGDEQFVGTLSMILNHFKPRQDSIKRMDIRALGPG